jgi:F0F1-type ATP synthase assembly protein I
MGLPGGVMEQGRRDGPGEKGDASRYLGAGLTSGLSTLLFLFLGQYADGRLGTGPWLTLVGALVGAAAGFFYMYHHLVVAPRQKRPRDGADS